jgi:PPOX class probable F420-dependent enzyme
MTVVDEFGRSKYVSLTTYRRNGDAVATPVWHVVDGGQLFIVSEAHAGKVKRIRNNPEVTVTVCGARGGIEAGAPSARGTARILDDAGTAKARDLLAGRYLMARLGNGVASLLRLRRPPMTGIAVSFSES